MSPLDNFDYKVILVYWKVVGRLIATFRILFVTKLKRILRTLVPEDKFYYFMGYNIT